MPLPITAPVSRWEGDRNRPRSPSPIPVTCPISFPEAREYRTGWAITWWPCVLDVGHPGEHGTERDDAPLTEARRRMKRKSKGGRNQSEEDRLERLRLIDAWEHMGKPQPTEGEIQGGRGKSDRFYEWLKSLVDGTALPIRQRTRRPVDDGGPTPETIRSMDELEEVVKIYSDFSEFAFDVETRGGRQVRMLQAGRRMLSRYGEQTTPCLACGKPIPSRRRAYCSDLCRKAADKDKPALDTQTNEVWCLSLAGPGVSHVIPMGHPDKRRQLHRADVFDALKPLFFSDRRKINQNVGFDLLSIAKYYGELPPPPYADIMTMVFLINENLTGCHTCSGSGYNLSHLAKHYIGFTYSEKLGEEAYNVGWNRAMTYSVTDAKMAWMVWWKLHHVLDKSKLGELFDLEMRVLRVLLQMRQQGAYVDVGGFQALRPRLEDQLTEITHEINDMVGHPINLNSTQQLGRWLYDELGLRCSVITDTGQRSTAAPALKALARRYKQPRKILEYKDVNKLLSTYVVGFMPHIDNDNRIRASFNQAVARTGRLSCSAPNLQNIPARYRQNTEGTMVRQLFVAPPGRVLIVADYSQIELRILAHQTKDKLLLYAYQHGLDLHTQTASLIYKVPQDQVDPEQRAIAKNSNFNLAFEGGPGRIMDMSGISRSEAEKVYDAWHRAYPGVKKWGNEMKRFCLHHGYVQTLYGRKRRLPDIRSADSQEQHYAERQAVNHPIQGTAADIAKIGIIQVHQALREFHAALTLQIHDEFVIECDEAEVDDAIPFIRTAMEDVRLDGHPVLDVPLEVNIGVGKNWHEAK